MGYTSLGRLPAGFWAMICVLTFAGISQACSDRQAFAAAARAKRSTVPGVSVVTDTTTSRMIPLGCDRATGPGSRTNTWTE